MPVLYSFCFEDVCRAGRRNVSNK